MHNNSGHFSCESMNQHKLTAKKCRICVVFNFVIFSRLSVYDGQVCCQHVFFMVRQAVPKDFQRISGFALSRQPERVK